MLDTGNGMGAVGRVRDLRAAPAVDTVRMYFELDGTFPNHPADPLVEENRREIVARVLAEKADLGIAWDGDADRCFFIDDTGEFVPGDFVTALLGESFARREPGARIVYDVRASRAVADRVSAAGGVPLMNRVGHAFIKKRMRDENAVFGGEVSGHFYFRDNWFADNGMIPALLVLEMRRPRGPPLERAPRARCASATTSRARSTHASTTCRARSPASRSATATAGSRGSTAISVDYDDWHFNVRPSNTEPLLRLNLEADDAGGHGAPPRRGARRHPGLSRALTRRSRGRYHPFGRSARAERA